MPHPLHLFRFCPLCGSADFQEHDARSKRCATCGFTYYHNASAATVAVIFNSRGELLVARRAMEPARGTLDLPGGFVDPGEGIVEGLLREIKEETGAEATAVRFLFSLPNVYKFSGFEVNTTDCFFECRIQDEADLHPSDDAAELFWQPLSEVRPSLFGLKSISQGVAKILAMSASDGFSR